jgi:hypothetical protein
MGRPGGRIRITASMDVASVEVGAKRAERSIDNIGDAAARTNAKLDGTSVSFDRASESTDRYSKKTRTASRDTDALSKHIQAVNARFTGMRNAVSLIKWPALISGAGYAAEGLGSVSAGAVALTSALAPLSGALLAYPALLGSVAQGLGVVQLALGGVSGALGEMSQQQVGAGETAKQSAKAQEAAAEGLRSAERQLTQAQIGAKRAQADLTHARQEAVEDLKDLKNAAIDAGFGEKRAAMSLHDAKAELKKALAEPGQHSNSELESLELGVREARQGLKEARLEKQRADREAAKGENQGVAGSPKYLEAKRQLGEANLAAADAARALVTAEKAQKEALEESGGAAGALTSKLESLPAATQKFAKYLFSLRRQLKALQGTAANGLLPGVEGGIQSALRLFPRLKAAVGDTGKVMGNVARRAGELIGSKGFGRDFSTVTEGNTKIIGRMGNSGLKLADALRHVLVAGQPLLMWMAKSGEEFATWLDNAARAGRETGKLGAFFDRTRGTMEVVGSIFKNVAVGLLEIGKAAFPLGNSILKSLNGQAENFADWTQSLEGKNALRDYFQQAKPGIFEVGRLIKDLGGAFLGLSDNEGFYSLTHEVRTQLVPVFKELLESTTKALGPALVQGLVQVGKLFGNLGGSSGPLVGFVNAVTRLFEAGNWMIDNIPGFKTLVVTMGGIVAVSKAMKFVGMISGLSTALGLAKKLATTVGLIETEQAIGGGLSIPGIGKGAAKGGLKGRRGGLLGLGTTVATTAAPLGMLSGAEVAAAGGAEAGGAGLLAAAPAAGPWLAVAAAVAAVGAGLFLLYKHSKAFRDIVDPVGNAAKAAFGEVKAQLKPLGDAVGELADSFGGNDGLVGEVKSFYQSFKGPIDGIAGLFKSVLVRGVEAGFDRISQTIRGLGKILSGQVQVIRGVVEILTGILTLKFGKAWQGVKDMFGGGIKVAIGALQTALSPITSAVKAIDGVLRDVFGGTWEKIKGIFRSGADAVIGFVQDIADVINLIPGIPDIEIGSDKSFSDRAGNINSVPGAPSGGLGKPKAQHRYTGGSITRPMVIVGEEAPQHPEWVIATNPQYRESNIGYWMQAGRDLGIPGFLSGGDITGAVGGAVGSAASSVGGAVGNVLGKGANFFIDKLPKPHLPKWLMGLGSYAIDHVADYIRNGFQDQALGAPGGSVVPSGKGLMTIDGKPVAEWIAKILLAARSRGIDFTVSSGYRSYAEQKAIYDSGVRPAAVPGTSRHEGKIYPMGAVDISPGAEALAGWLGHSRYAHTLIYAGAKDPVHFSHPTGGGYAKGGQVQFLAQGGVVGTVARYLRNSGLNQVGTAGILGNAARESLLNPASEGTGGGGLWGFTTSPISLADLKAEAESRGVPWDDAKFQTDFMWNGPVPASSLMGMLNAASSPQEAARLFMENWEHPGVLAQGERETKAARLYEAIDGIFGAGGGKKARKGKAGGKGKTYPAGHTGKGGGTYGSPGPAHGKPPHMTETALPGLAATPLEPAANALPAQIQAMLSAPGLTFSQKLSIGELAGTIAGGTQQRTFDAEGHETSSDSHADDIAAAQYQKGLVQADKKRVQKRLAEIAKKLKQPHTKKQERALLAEQSQLLDRLGSDTSKLQGLNETIGTQPDEPEQESKQLQEIKQILEEQLSLEKQKNEETQRALNVSQSQYGVLAQAITAVVSGQIGGMVGLGFQTPSVAGSLASY